MILHTSMVLKVTRKSIRRGQPVCFWIYRNSAKITFEGESRSALKMYFILLNFYFLFLNIFPTYLNSFEMKLLNLQNDETIWGDLVVCFRVRQKKVKPCFKLNYALLVWIIDGFLNGFLLAFLPFMCLSILEDLRVVTAIFFWRFSDFFQHGFLPGPGTGSSSHTKKNIKIFPHI